MPKDYCCYACSEEFDTLDEMKKHLAGCKVAKERLAMGDPFKAALKAADDIQKQIKGIKNGRPAKES